MRPELFHQSKKQKETFFYKRESKSNALDFFAREPMLEEQELSLFFMRSQRIFTTCG